MLRLVFFSFLFACCNCVNSQTLTNTTGSTLINSGYYFEYSIGEVSITSLQNNSFVVTQGLLQPNLKRTPPPCDFMSNKFISFENPTSNLVRLVGQYDWITSYQIFSVDGKLVKSASFYNNVIEISDLPSALYFIKLFPGCNGTFKTIKILKQN